MPLNIERPLVFFDLETTSKEIQTALIVEISLLKLFPDNHEEIHTMLINPGIPIPPDATAIHHITDEDVANEPGFPERAPIILEILNGSDLCGYNLIRFDLPILRMEFSRYNIPFDIIGINLIDPMRIFMKNEPRDLTSALKFYCNESLEDAHSAEADIIATKKVLIAQLEKYSELPKTIKQLSDYNLEGTSRFADITGKLIYNENNEIVFAFGKHKGKKIIDNPDYCKWVLDSDFPEDTKLFIRNLLSANINN